MKTSLSNCQIASITLALCLSLLCLLLQPTRTQAAAATVLVVGGSGNAAELTLVKLMQSLVNKEYKLDPAANKAVSKVAEAYVKNTHKVLASGERGKPVYIGNLEIYRYEIKSAVAESAVQELQDSNICNTFKTEVVAKIAENHTNESTKTIAEKSSCSLDTATKGNTEAFLEGDFSQGGIQALFKIAQNPENTPLGSYYANERRVREQMDEAEENALIQANWSRGIKEYYGPNQDVIVCSQGEVSGIRNNCRVQKPGSIWFEELVKGLNLSVDMLTKSDEIGEDATAKIFIELAKSSTQPPGITGIVEVPEDPEPVDTCPTNDPAAPCNQALLVQIMHSLDNATATSTNPIYNSIKQVLAKLTLDLTVSKDVKDMNGDIASALEQYQSFDCYEAGSMTIVELLRIQKELSDMAAPDSIAALKEIYPLFLAYEKALADGESTLQILANHEQLVAISANILEANVLYEHVMVGNMYIGPTFNSFNKEHKEDIAECKILKEKFEEFLEEENDHGLGID